MGRTPSTGLAAIFKEADRSGDLRSAWVAGGQVTSFKNCQRAYKLHVKPAAAVKKVKKAAPLKPMASSKPSQKKVLRLPSRFVEAAAKDAVRHRKEWEVAHQEMTEEAEEVMSYHSLSVRMR